MTKNDLIVIGGGIVGLATAYRYLKRFPQKKVLVLEKEHSIAQHQTGHNSGVLHSGIYYKPGSLKAQLCRSGKKAMEHFCHENDIPYDICGKIIVATNDKEMPLLYNLFNRAKENDIRCDLVSKDHLKDIEPHVAGIEALHVHDTGIVDFIAVCHSLAKKIRFMGGEIHTETKVHNITQTDSLVIIETSKGTFQSNIAVNCAGLHSDKIAQLSGVQTDLRIIPFRGEYFKLRDNAVGLCKNLIYPVPDPNFPFLGVHFTRMISGGVECGPNAVLALAREGYSWKHINIPELMDTITYPAFWHIAHKYWKTGLGEIYRSLSKDAFVRALQRLVPEIQKDDLIPEHAGVRAQALSVDGKLLDDFAIYKTKRMIHVCNAPSPAATSSLSIANKIVDQLL